MERAWLPDCFDDTGKHTQTGLTSDLKTRQTEGALRAREATFRAAVDETDGRGVSRKGGDSLVSGGLHGGFSSKGFSHGAIKAMGVHLNASFEITYLVVVVHCGGGDGEEEGERGAEVDGSGMGGGGGVEVGRERGSGGEKAVWFV